MIGLLKISNREGDLVYSYWGCLSIDHPLSYPEIFLAKHRFYNSFIMTYLIRDIRGYGNGRLIMIKIIFELLVEILKTASLEPTNQFQVFNRIQYRGYQTFVSKVQVYLQKKTYVFIHSQKIVNVVTFSQKGGTIGLLLLKSPKFYKTLSYSLT